MTLNEILAAFLLAILAAFLLASIFLGFLTSMESNGWVPVTPPPDSHFSHCWEKKHPTRIVCE